MTGDGLVETGYKSIPVGLVKSIHDALCSQREPHRSCDPLDLDHTAYDAAAAVLESDWLAAVRDEAASEAWDEGHRLTAPHSDACEPTCPNPYRAAALRAAPPTEAIPEELWEQEHAAYRAEQDTEPTEGES